MAYQTILLVIQGLPRQLETIDRFSTIIGAPFRGGARCPGVIVDAFNEFWGSAYPDVNEPEGGWPSPIKAALQVSRQGDETPSAAQDRDTLVLTENDCQTEQGSRQKAGETTVSRENMELLEAPGITIVDQSRPQDTTTDYKPPSTPRKERRTHISIPPRRHRATSSPKTPHPLGPEPCSPLTDLRKGKISSGSFYTSPTPKSSDKENARPKPLLDMFASVLGKRKVEPTIEDSPSYAKRRLSSSKSLKTIRTSAVTGDSAAIASEGLTETAAGDGVTHTPSKKRKNEVFVGVELPTVKEVMLRRRHSAPLKEVADSQPSGHPTFTSTTALRKPRSTARMDAIGHRDMDLEASPRKKVRTIRSGESVTPMVDFPVAGSGKYTRLGPHDDLEADPINYWRIDDSIVTVDPSMTIAQLSSDDDPIKLGRYTPRVLMSPALSVRRLNEKRWDEEDVGSDDSVEPNSPTRDVIERRKKMGWPSTQRAADRGRGVLVP